MQDDKPTPAGHQPTKAEMEEVISIDGTPDEIAAAVLGGGAPRREVGVDDPVAFEASKDRTYRRMLKALRVETPKGFTEDLPVSQKSVRR